MTETPQETPALLEPDRRVGLVLGLYLPEGTTHVDLGAVVAIAAPAIGGPNEVPIHSINGQALPHPLRLRSIQLADGRGGAVEAECAPVAEVTAAGATRVPAAPFEQPLDETIHHDTYGGSRGRVLDPWDGIDSQATCPWPGCESSLRYRLGGHTRVTWDDAQDTRCPACERLVRLTCSVSVTCGMVLYPVVEADERCDDTWHRQQGLDGPTRCPSCARGALVDTRDLFAAEGA